MPWLEFNSYLLLLHFERPSVTKHGINLINIGYNLKINASKVCSITSFEALIFYL